MVEMLRTTALNTVHKHRWILVVPFVFLMVFFTVREGYMRMGAEIADSGSGIAVEVLADEGALFTVSKDDTFELEAGGLLVDAVGIAMVHAGDWTVSVWGGGVYVSFQHDTLTVAALDIPVIVRGSRGIVIIPAHRQWTDPLVALPDPITDPVAWTQSTQTRPLPALFMTERLSAVHALRAARMQHPVEHELDETDVRSVAMHALSTRQTRALAGALRVHADLRLYAFIHPIVRDAAWAFVPNDAKIDTDTWVAILSLPTLTSAERPASPLTARIWGETVRRAVATSARSNELLSHILPALEVRIVAAASGGFPLRALHFAHALHAAVGSGGMLTNEAQASFVRLGAMTPDSLRASVLVDTIAHIEAPVRESVTTVVHVEADPTLEQRVREVMAARGGMLTKDSSITTFGSGVVEVKDVIFGLPGGDRALRFVYDVDGDTVRAVINGAVQPYSVSFDVYMAWERTR